jgi:hypothetical protein
MNRLTGSSIRIAAAAIVLTAGAEARAQLAPLPVVQPGGTPAYLSYPNWANSPSPGGVATATFHGNALQARNTPTDGATNVLVVNPAVLPAGNLVSFQTHAQTGSGGAAGNTFHAYVLRPTGVANEYTVAFDSGALTVGPLAAGTQTFTLATPFPVLAGDVIAHYGNGIPIDIGAGVDTVAYPAPAAPVAGTTITVGGGGFPLCGTAVCGLRTYSIGANVEVQTLSGGMRKFVDSLPGLNSAARNNLGQYIPVAIPDTTTYPGSDYYEIELGQYTERMHSDLPPTTLRGYRQTNTSDTNVSAFHYLGPRIVSQKDRPVRI